MTDQLAGSGKREATVDRRSEMAANAVGREIPWLATLGPTSARISRGVAARTVPANAAPAIIGHSTITNFNIVLPLGVSGRTVLSRRFRANPSVRRLYYGVTNCETIAVT
jgi:hypothetical protein